MHRSCRSQLVKHAERRRLLRARGSSKQAVAKRGAQQASGTTQASVATAAAAQTEGSDSGNPAKRLHAGDALPPLLQLPQLPPMPAPMPGVTPLRAS